MVKRSHGVNVHNLIQKIENHPQRQSLQSDLQQHRAFNPFSKESQDAIKAAGNTELCETVDVEPKAQCRACLAYWDVGIVYCTCGHLTAPSSSASSRPGILTAPSQQFSNLIAHCAGKPAAGGSNQNDAASSSQVWLTDAKLSERARAGTNQDQSFQERARKLAAENSDINDQDDSKWPHNCRISRANVPHFKKVYSNLRQQLKRKPEDKMDNFDVNTWMWGMFVIVTQQAAVHLGNDCLVSLPSRRKLLQF